MSKCIVEGCDRVQQSKQLCSMHYTRNRRHGDPSIVLNRRGMGAVCSVEDCNDEIHSNGFCGRHDLRFRRHGDPLFSINEQQRKSVQDWLMAAAFPDTDECIEWPGPTSADGYGMTAKNEYGTSTVHRQVLQIATGQSGAGLYAAHQPVVCHNKVCANARHLRWATPTENVLDKKLDGTHNMGTEHYAAKLTESAVIEILSRNDPPKICAADYGISKTTVSDIRAGRTWKHLHKGTNS